jgi:hypothetical protein
MKEKLQTRLDRINSAISEITELEGYDPEIVQDALAMYRRQKYELEHAIIDYEIREDYDRIIRDYQSREL